VPQNFENPGCYIGLDDVVLYKPQTGQCPFRPEAARPEPTTTTTTESTTTETEPPIGGYHSSKFSFQMVIKFSLVGEIKCDFETDLCDWNAEGEEKFLLSRENPASLQILGLEGPEYDFEGDPEKYFAHVSAFDLEVEKKTTLKSVEISTQIHPVKCIKFWFQILVN